jgi:hypothetical protein
MSQYRIYVHQKGKLAGARERGIYVDKRGQLYGDTRPTSSTDVLSSRLAGLR